MNKILKNNQGITLIALVLIFILTIIAGGTTFLGVRSLITKEPFLQPFENMGLMEIEDEEETKKENKKKDELKENKEEVKEEEVEEEEEDKDSDKKPSKIKGEESSLLVEEINDKGVGCYTIEIDLKEVADGIVPILQKFLTVYMFTGVDGGTVGSGDAVTVINSTLEIIPDIFVDSEIIIDCYANGNNIKQVLITFEYTGVVNNLYNAMTEIEELLVTLDPAYEKTGYSSAEEMLKDFEETILTVCTTENIRSVLSENDTDSKYAEIIKTAECVVEDGKIQVSLNLSSISIDEYIGKVEDELVEMGIDPDNVVESAVEAWNSYINDVGYNGAIESVYKVVTGTYDMFGI